MRVLLFTSEEPLYLPEYVAPVLSAHADAVSAVVVAPPRTPLCRQLRRQYRMFGPANFARMGARFARGKLLDALPVETERFHSVRAAARAHDVPVWRTSDVRDPEFVSRVGAVDPDVVLSIVCGQRLPPGIVDPPAEAINLHGSLLPKYRGRAVAFWPLYHGDDETGVTAHRMTQEFDAGPILRRRRVPIAPDDSMHDLYRKLASAGAELAVDLLAELPDAEFDPEPNEATDDNYYTLPSPAERREFLRRGNEFV